MIEVGDTVKRHDGRTYTVLSIAKNRADILDGWIEIESGLWLSPLVLTVVTKQGEG